MISPIVTAGSPEVLPDVSRFGHAAFVSHVPTGPRQTHTYFGGPVFRPIMTGPEPVFEPACRWYDGDVMMARTQITLQPEVQRRARQRAGDLGVSFAEYVRRLVVRDLGNSPAKADPALVFDLGESRRSDIAKDKDAMVAEAFAAAGVSRRRR